MSRSFLLIGFVGAVALAQSPPYRLAERVLDEGGRKAVALGADFTARGSFHQTTIGRSSSSDLHYSGWIGFWHPWPRGNYRDVGVVEVHAPAAVEDTLLFVTPAATIRDYGDYREMFWAFFVITRTNGTPVYRDSAQLVLEPWGQMLVTFRPLRFSVVGPYVARCSTALAEDENAANNLIYYPFKVLTRPPWPQGWWQTSPMPAGPMGRPVRRGGWLVYNRNAGRFYAAKGNKTADFFDYDAVTNDWRGRSQFKLGQEAKLPAGGAVGAGDGTRYVYALKGNNTLGFWRYDAVLDTWLPLTNVPLGHTGKRVKAGSDLAFVTKDDSEYVYMLKGCKTEFWRYSVARGQWDSMPDAPAGNRAKYDKGSWLCFDGERYLYCHKAKFHEFYRFDTWGDSWCRQQLVGMPIFNERTGRSKTARDGSAAAWYDGAVFALKGGNTQEFWKYTVSRDSWAELETIPMYGSSQRPVRVKDGGDIAAFGEGVFLAMKGNKTTEVWRYVLSTEIIAPQPNRSGVMAAQSATADCRLTIAPNPVTSDFAVLHWSTGPLGHSTTAVARIIDVSGREVARWSLPGRSGQMRLDLGALSPGVYFVKLPTDENAVTRKLILNR